VARRGGGGGPVSSRRGRAAIRSYGTPDFGPARIKQAHIGFGPRVLWLESSKKKFEFAIPRAEEPVPSRGSRTKRNAAAVKSGWEPSVARILTPPGQVGRGRGLEQEVSIPLQGSAEAVEAFSSRAQNGRRGWVCVGPGGRSRTIGGLTGATMETAAAADCSARKTGGRRGFSGGIFRAFCITHKVETGGLFDPARLRGPFLAKTFEAILDAKAGAVLVFRFHSAVQNTTTFDGVFWPGGPKAGGRLSKGWFCPEAGAHHRRFCFAPGPEKANRAGHGGG